MGPTRDTVEQAESAGDELMCGETLECETVRKPVGIVSDSDGMYAICDDGSLFSRIHGNENWIECPPIPGTEADK
jgi:hypothetical protein